MIGEITYSYTPEDWSQERFLELGGFTVVFLNYNKAAFIEKSVASALNQDFERLEMFFMDDASPDGSGDTMEQLVRAYRGRHKVTVVRNTENQHITGQWNIVSKLATGNWLGMFCADDIAHADRASKVAKILAEFPSAKGVDTRAEVYDKDISGGLIKQPSLMLDPPHLAESGRLPLELLVKPRHDIFGATAWWHKSLFEKSLPKAPLDDVLLRWVLQMKNLGEKEDVWLSYMDVYTIDYIRGDGITSEMLNDGMMSKGVRKWVRNSRAGKKMASVFKRTYAGVHDYAKSNGHLHVFDSYILSASIPHEIIAGNTFSRLTMIPRMVRLMHAPLISADRKFLCVRMWIKYFLRDFFGDYMAGCMMCVRKRLGL